MHDDKESKSTECRNLTAENLHEKFHPDPDVRTNNIHCICIYIYIYVMFTFNVNVHKVLFGICARSIYCLFEKSTEKGFFFLINE